MTKTVSPTAQPKTSRVYGAKATMSGSLAQSRAVRPVPARSSSSDVDQWTSVMKMTIDLSAIDQHGLVQVGVPTAVLDKVVASFVRLDESEVLGAVGVSSRTVQRRKSGLLSPEHSGAMLDLIAITQRAMEVLGSREAAENWLHQPALAFDGRRPIELLKTRQGGDLVKEHLTRMDYGVYA